MTQPNPGQNSKAVAEAAQEQTLFSPRVAKHSGHTHVFTKNAQGGNREVVWKDRKGYEFAKKLTDKIFPEAVGRNLFQYESAINNRNDQDIEDIVNEYPTQEEEKYYRTMADQYYDKASHGYLDKVEYDSLNQWNKDTSINIEPNPGPPKYAGTKKQRRKLRRKLRREMGGGAIGVTALRSVSKPQRPLRQRMRRSKRTEFVRKSDGVNNAQYIKSRADIVDRFQRCTEKITDIIGTSAFSNTLGGGGLYINPANSIMFPIFSGIAASYEKYRLRYLRFRYVAEAYTAVNSASSPGKVIMVVNYDPTDPSFLNDEAAENYGGMVKSTPFVSTSLIVNHKKNLNSLGVYFVNPSQNSSGYLADSPKFYDVGLFQLITQNNAVTTYVGELWVDYAFDMINPKQNLASSITSAGFSHIYTTGDSTSASPLGEANTIFGSNPLGIQVPTTSNTKFSFTAQNTGYMIVLSCISSTIAAVLTISTIVTVPASSSNQYLLMNNDETYTANAFVANVGSLATYFYYFNGECSVTFTLSTTAGLSAGSIDVYVVPVPLSLSLQRSMKSKLTPGLTDRVDRLIGEKLSALQAQIDEQINVRDDLSRRILELKDKIESKEEDDLVSVVSFGGSRRMVANSTVNNRK